MRRSRYFTLTTIRQPAINFCKLIIPDSILSYRILFSMINNAEILVFQVLNVAQPLLDFDLK
ncbi:hypothetical protein BCD64_21245 [Nostoc sp. MBR 210]|nr:hypothetical protein BCD64_21245 [Nostoc sp. MBR 210]